MPHAVAVLGAGSWGTALAWILARCGGDVRLWCRREEQAAQIRAERLNRQYLPQLQLPDSITATHDLALAAIGADLVVVACPTASVRATLRALVEAAGVPPGITLAAKGLERDTGMRLSEVAIEELGPAPRLAVLSGPNLAGEIVREIPSATVIASHDPDWARRLQSRFATPFFRVYTNSDVAGVELGGALKNPIAIAAGISDGLGFGANTRATLLTRGLAEITRLGEAAGGRAETFRGLSGLGDLMATAGSPLSRNYRLGMALGSGVPLAEALASLHQVAEGVPTTTAAVRLAASLNVDIPLLTELHALFWEHRPVAEAVRGLLSRPYRDE